MASTAAGVYMQPLNAGRRRKVSIMASFALAATTGVATLLDTDDINVTLSRTAGGTYALAFPAAPVGTQVGTNGKAHIDCVVLNSGTDAAGMAASARLSAINPQAGTATIKLMGGNSGVPIDPLAADVVTLYVQIDLDCNA